MGDVFDLDALEVEEAEKPFQFRFGGEIFEITVHLDPRIFRRAEMGDLVGALTALIGKEQFDRLDAIDQPFDERHLSAVVQQWAAHVGTTVGEASASSRSSKSTGRPSKRTSKGSTASR